MTKKNKASFFENVNQIDKLLPGLRERERGATTTNKQY